jgi:hypothetical protein
MLGLYENFPKNIHRAEKFQTSTSSKKLQQTLVETLYKLNIETLSLEEFSAPSVPGCKVIFEVGVAEGNDFSYLNNEERERLLGVIKKKPLQIMDFLCVIRYQKTQEERKKRMRFDYYMLRLVFGESVTDILVSHERGVRHTSPEDLIGLVVSRINASFSKKVFRASEQT